jgi:dihydropteroate synthase
MLLNCGHHTLDLSTPVVMGVLNVTPDSFSDGGRFLEPAAAVERALRMVEEGAGIVDIGGESTRPGAVPVPVEEELARVLPVLERLAGALPVPVSVDSSKPEVMRQAIAAGAGMVNDVRALRPRALEIRGPVTRGVCLMHMQGEPRPCSRRRLRRRGRGGPRLPGRPACRRACEAGHRRRPHRIDPGLRVRQDARAQPRAAGLARPAGAEGLPVLVGCRARA